MMDASISSSLKETRRFEPPKDVAASAHIRGEAEYSQLYRESVERPDIFWAKQAEENLAWSRKWTRVMVHDFLNIGQTEAPYVRFFEGGQLNVSYNCLDRHVAGGYGERTAIVWQGDDPGAKRKLTYKELLDQVAQFANVLKKHGVKKGETVTLFLPMTPEAAIAMLACARIGAVHSVVFSAFSAESLKNRVADCASRFVITADAGFYGGKRIGLKEKVDEAICGKSTVECVIVLRHADGQAPMKPGRDFWWHDQMQSVASQPPAEPEPMDSEDPFFILYTSGSTGKPKGVLHTTAGYLLHAHLTFKWIFDARPGDVHFCTADVGWITGHSYVVYGPLSNGVTAVMFEGVPTWPEPDRFWKIIDENGVNIFYTAPTAIRALMRFGEEIPGRFSLKSLRTLGSVGEPINPEAWMWYHRVVGREKCPVMDTWWQTETGGILISPLPGAIATKPGSASKPFFGVVPEVRTPDGRKAAPNEGGSLVITKPWPGMLRGVWGDPKNELIQRVYFSAFPDAYTTGDGCRVDEEGFYWLLGRIDDVINVSAHRFATAEIESALVAHTGVAEAAVVGFPHELKGQGIHCFVTLKQGIEAGEDLRKALIAQVRKDIGPIATPDRIQFSPALPKTRSGKIMRRILRKIAEGDIASIGDTSTLADPTVVESLVKSRVF